MIKRFSKILVLATIVFSIYFSCKDNGAVTGNEEDCKPVSPTDSTRHNFIWRLDTLGEGNGSVLNDVFVVNDTLAYAVGEIYLKDSTGQYDPLPYNIATWNGTKWTFKKVVVSLRGNLITAPLYGVFAFSPTDVWLSAGVPIHGDGQQWTQFHLFDMGVLGPNDGPVRKIWGTNSTNLWFVGDKGTVAYYNGSTWQKLASGTTLDIFDIYGAENCRGETEILAVASNFVSVPQGKKLLRISGTTLSAVSDDGLPLAISSTWFAPRQRYYVVGDGVYRADALGGSWQQDSGHPLLYKFCIRGLASNDIVVSGSYGLISHFNGSTWRHFTGSEVPSFFGSYTRVAIHSRLVIAVGDYERGKAVALVGRR